MTQLVFWDQYSRELPGLISVPLHISVGIHAEGELTHFFFFCKFHPPVDVCTFGFTQDEGWHCLADKLGFG